jgi:hypothetical protein
MLRRRGRAGDVQRASSMIDAASIAAQQSGMHGLVQRIAAESRVH